MQMNLSDADRAFRDEVRAFLAAELPPAISEKVLAGHGLSRDDYITWHKKLNAKGWACPHWPVEYGGCDWSPIQHYIFETELGEAGAPGEMPFGPDMVAPVIMHFGTDEQKEQHLPGILNADVFWCQGYSEPNSGSDLASLKCKAILDGDHYVVNGGKTWTTMGHWADWMFCLVRTDSSGKKQEGISFLLIDMKSPGISINPIITMEGGHEVNTVMFDDVRVPVANLIGEQDKGWTYAKFLLGYERTNMAGIPQAKRALRRVKEIAANEMDGDKPLIDNPRFRHKLADTEIQILALEATTLRLLADQVAGKTPGPEASFIKIRGTEIDQALTELTMDAVGNYALPFIPEAMEDGWNEEPVGPDYAMPAAPTYFNTRKVTIYGGSNEIQKNIIAKAVLGL